MDREQILKYKFLLVEGYSITLYETEKGVIAEANRRINPLIFAVQLKEVKPVSGDAVIKHKIIGLELD